jgi:putative ABC transport system permease protein
MKKQMIIAGLAARPVRTLVSVLAVALEVTLILVVVGLTTGISTETAKRTEGVGADIMFQPPNSSLFLAINNASMPLALEGAIRKIEGVTAVAPVQTLVNSSSGLEIIYGIDPDKFAAVSGGFIWHEGGMFSGIDDVVVDDVYALAKKVHAGDTVELLNHKFRVAGIVEHGKGARLFIAQKTARELTGLVDRASVFYVKISDPEQVNTVIERMSKVFPAYGLRPLREYAKLMMSTSMPALDAFIETVVFVALCIGVLVIFLSMYTTITERTREIGILRSLGASKQFIVSLIFQESALVCFLGIVIGVGSSLLIGRGVQMVFPTLIVDIGLGWIAKAAGFALLSGIIGSLYPSIKAAGQDPVEALAYE